MECVICWKKYFWWLLRRVKNLRSTACKHLCKHYRKCDDIYRYLHNELIWCLLMVQYLQNNLIMKWTTHFIHFTGWIPLKYGSTTTSPIIAHCQKTPMSSVVFHIAIPKTSNIRRTPSFDLLTEEFSKRVSVIRWQNGTMNHIADKTVPWIILLLKMAMLGQFLHVPRNFQIS